jgi:membrane associated rhomboid family serine protease
MGIYDREYYRREGASFLDPISSRGRVCLWLVGVNIIVFVIQLVTRQRLIPAELEPFASELGYRFPLVPGPFTAALILDPNKVLQGEVWRLLTYAFLHSPDNILHIVFNMLFLVWFGTDVEDLYGPREFLAFYLTSAVAGGGFYVLSQTTIGNPAPALGASGAVTAVLVLCAFHFPSRVILLFFVLPVPIWAFVVFQVAQDVFGFLGGGGGGTVAFAVHLGGAAFALVYYKLQLRIMNLWPNVGAWQQSRSRPPLRVYREEAPISPPPVSLASPPPAGDEHDEYLEAKLDAVLEKMKRLGRDSLTESEQQILMRASELYKKRRS